MKTILIIFIFFFVQNLSAQEIVAVSPGLKFGYAFGEKGGFIFGIEVSAVWINSSDDLINNYGTVISLESMKGETRLHFGVQTNFYMSGDFWGLLGLEIGPTFIFKDSRDILGINITQYYGAFFIPYYRLLIVPGEYLQNEVGSFLKLHLPLKGKYSLGH